MEKGNPPGTKVFFNWADGLLFLVPGIKKGRLKEETLESELLQGLARNDRKAVEAIYKANFNLIQALVVNNNGTAEDAKDIFQEAVMVLYRKVQGEGFTLNCLIRTYLYAVARRLWLKRLMQQHRFASAEGEPPAVAVEDDLEAHRRRDAEFELMEKAMGGLGEPCKSLLEAFYLRKQSMGDIAAQFGYTNTDNAKNQKYKCLVRLKKLFFSQYKTEDR